MKRWKCILTLQLFLFFVFLQASYVDAEENVRLHGGGRATLSSSSDAGSQAVNSSHKVLTEKQKVESKGLDAHIQPPIGHLPDFFKIFINL